MGKVKDVEFLEAMEDIGRAEGLEDFEYKLLGGLQILIKCSSEKAAIAVANDKYHRLTEWVVDIKKWSTEWNERKRLCWINIEGVPLRGWSENTFRLLAEHWGVPYEFSNCDFINATNFMTGRVLILTDKMDTIKSIQSMVVNGEKTTIIVKEDCNKWGSDINSFKDDRSNGYSSEFQSGWSENSNSEDDKELHGEEERVRRRNLKITRSENKRTAILPRTKYSRIRQKVIT